MPVHDRFIMTCGRVLLSLIFLLSGLNHLVHFSAGVSALASKGFPLPSIAMAVAIAMLLVGGMSLIAGYQVRLGAALLAVFLVVVTPVFHDFWAYQGGEAEQQQIHFMKNVAMLGGVLIAYATARRHLDAGRGPGI